MKFLEMRCSEMVSEAILGQKQSCRSYIVRKVLQVLNFRENRTGTMVKGGCEGLYLGNKKAYKHSLLQLSVHMDYYKHIYTSFMNLPCSQDKQ